MVIKRKIYILVQNTEKMKKQKQEDLVKRIKHLRTELASNMEDSLEFTERVCDFSEELGEKYYDIQRVEAYHALIGSTYKKEQVVQEHPANKDINEFIKNYF